MSDPYRDPQLKCPACKATLRAFQTRQVCDACNGIMMSIEDLAQGVHDLTSIVPTFEYKDEQPGARLCPHCSTAMLQCKLRIVLEDEVEKPRPDLDRCTAHGIWFDHEELAKVFEKVTGKGHGSGEAHKTKSRGTDDRDQGRWSAMFKKFGGHGGF